MPSTTVAGSFMAGTGEVFFNQARRGEHVAGTTVRTAAGKQGGRAGADDPEATQGRRRPDTSQDLVIAAPVDSRQIVESGPGYGKTDVACARVADLIARGVPPARILLLSFTRTAVREMRDRIAALAKQGVDVRGVVIRTLDSFAWRLRTGESERDPAARVFGFEDSIRDVVEKLDNPSDDLKNHLGSFRHVFVDEAQDLVGARAELVVKLLNKVRRDGGWTAFCDPAQAIYGWEQDGAGGVDGQRFVDLAGSLEGKVERRALTRLYRTANKELVDLLTASRSLVTSDGVEQRADAVRDALLQLAPEDPTDFDKLAQAMEADAATGSSSFVLFRNRGDAQTLSSYLAEAGVAHRLRFGGLPRIVSPWVACVVNAVGKRELTRAAFDAAWKQLEGSWLRQGWDDESAWNILRAVAAKQGTKLVDVSLLAQRLASPSPPDQLCLRDVGQGGPIVGTVHGSKGRETDRVTFCVNPEGWDGEDQDSEARVLYVGLSRARQRLDVRRLRTTYWKPTLSSGRWWRTTRKGVQVQIGLQGDVDPIGSLNACSGGPVVLQQALAGYDGRVHHLTGIASKDHGWARRLVPKDANALGADAIGWLSQNGNLTKDLWTVARGAWGEGAKPPNKLYHLWWVDLTAVAIREDHPVAERLPQPWKTTRIWLCPVIVGMSSIFKPGGNRS